MELRVDRFFPDVPARYWADHPEACAGPGRIAASAGGLLVQRQGRCLLIDAGPGVADGDLGVAVSDSGALLDTLTALGHVPQDIEALAFTHLHTDHTGWGFVRDADGKPAKTFPKARYLMTEAEWVTDDRDDIDATNVRWRRSTGSPVAGSRAESLPLTCRFPARERPRPTPVPR